MYSEMDMFQIKLATTRVGDARASRKRPNGTAAVSSYWDLSFTLEFESVWWELCEAAWQRSPLGIFRLWQNSLRPSIGDGYTEQGIFFG